MASELSVLRLGRDIYLGLQWVDKDGQSCVAQARASSAVARQLAASLNEEADKADAWKPGDDADKDGGDEETPVA